MGSPIPSLPDSVRDVVPAVKTLVVTDLVDSTRLLSSVGDRRGAELSARHERLARDLLVDCSGREIDKTDGFLLLFDRTADAVRYALAYHRALSALAAEEEVELTARVGIHLGEVFLRSNPPDDVARGAKPVELEGFAKMIAARVMGLAKGRQTLITRAAFDLARQSAAHEKLADEPLRWLAHGPYLLKGIAEPVEVFEVGVSGFAPLAVPKSTVKARRAVSAGDEITLGWRPAPGLEVPRRANWVLAEKLGEGGFGEVWLARHDQTGEVRVFKFCYQADRLRSLQREVTLFRLLKETLGARDDIARILEWNFERAPYFLECEYTEGGNLLEWVAEQGGPGAVPLATKLELLAQVADALAAAHSVGVLHKDVKPANVLITTDNEGRPKVRLTDFGIGLITNREIFSRQGITVFDLTEMVAGSATSAGGTHLYMAPELVEGRTPTVQADVYALGVMLYQLVVGDFTRSLAPGWRRDVEDDLLRDDIAEMVEGRPERRLRDAQAVAERLRTLDERRAEREAEERARRQREAEHQALERAHRRRRAALAIAAAAVVVLAVVSYLAVQAVQARREAERRRGQAERLIGFMVGDLRKKLEPIGRLDVLDDVGDHALQYFSAVPESDLTDEEVFRRSETLRQIGEVRTNRGDLPAARKAFVESLELGRRLAARDPDNDDWQKGLGASHFWIGYVDWRQNDLERAEAEFREYQAIAERMAAKRQHDADWQLEVAYAQSNLGSIAEARGHLEQARDAYTRSLAIRQNLAERDAASSELRRGLAVAHNKLGSVLERLGEPSKALEHFQAELGVLRGLSREDPSDRTLQYRQAISSSFVGTLLEAFGHASEALSYFRASADALSDLTREDPSNSSWRHELAMARLWCARAMIDLGELGRGRDELASATSILGELVKTAPSERSWRADLANLRITTGDALFESGHLAESRAELDRGLRLVETLRSERPADLKAAILAARGRLLAGKILERQGEAARAREAWEQALGLVAPRAAHSSDRELLTVWSEALLLLDRLDQATAPIHRLLEMGYHDQALLRLSRTKGLVLPSRSSPAGRPDGTGP